jgi:hypothetical protein
MQIIAVSFFQNLSIPTALSRKANVVHLVVNSFSHSGGSSEVSALVFADFSFSSY